jgi:hypothetical protein
VDALRRVVLYIGVYPPRTRSARLPAERCTSLGQGYHTQAVLVHSPLCLRLPVRVTDAGLQGFEKAINEVSAASLNGVQRSVVLAHCYRERAKCLDASGKDGTQHHAEPYVSFDR